MTEQQITGREAEGRAIVHYARNMLRLNLPQALTALTRAVAIVLDELPDEGRAMGYEAVCAMLKDRSRQ